MPTSLHSKHNSVLKLCLENMQAQVCDPAEGVLLFKPIHPVSKPPQYSARGKAGSFTSVLHKALCTSYLQSISITLRRTGQLLNTWHRGHASVLTHTKETLDGGVIDTDIHINLLLCGTPICRLPSEELIRQTPVPTRPFT